MKYDRLRIVWSYDPEPDLSYLEQWDTPEKYYGGAPNCPKCGEPMQYEAAHNWVCTNCIDQPPVIVEWDGNEKGGQIIVDGKKLPFDKYERTYGNPSKHITLMATVEGHCTCCGSWAHISSLGGCDYLDRDSPFVGTFYAVPKPGSMERGLNVLPAAQREESQSLLEETRKEVADE